MPEFAQSPGEKDGDAIRLPRADSLQAGAIAALEEADLGRKVSLTRALAEAWFARRLARHASSHLRLPARPGRPERPHLVPPGQVPRRGLGSDRGRVALIHALCHIELNAIDLALDIVARFARESLPRSFFDDWMTVASEEAKHFSLLRDRLGQYGADYGDLPAHDGLWEAAQTSEGNLHARLALVPLVLEARGLDVTPSLIEATVKAGDHRTADILRIIYEDEKGHVSVGAKWFRFLCRRNGEEPASAFQDLVRRHFRGTLKPPFNDRARARSGITPAFYRTLSPLGN
ncbi:MAG: ferritin-like domain-containing protein [Pseudomonadota bacterium]|nr:ferritin-like domain-containing protein [Pseudomonadota bacterium]